MKYPFYPPHLGPSHIISFPVAWRALEPYANLFGRSCLGLARALYADVNPKFREFSVPKKPMGESAFVAPFSTVSTTALLAKNSSVWFNAQVGASVKLGAGSCIMDGAVVEDGCEIGEATVIKQGAVVKKGSRIGSRVVVGMGSVLPENSNIKDFTVMVDGWNGSSVKDSSESTSEAEEEALFIMNCALEQQIKWSRTPLEREIALFEAKEDIWRVSKILEKKPTWDAYLPQDPNRSRAPERKGLVYDKH